MNVSQMPAGPELDARVAEDVMECKLANCDDMGRKYVGCFNAEHHHKASGVLPSIPCYSTDIAAAWEVVGKVGDINLDSAGTSWIAVFQKGVGRADTAPLAICRAALEAVRGNDA